MGTENSSIFFCGATENPATETLRTDSMLWYTGIEKQEQQEQLQNGEQASSCISPLSSVPDTTDSHFPRATSAQGMEFIHKNNMLNSTIPKRMLEGNV